MVTALANAVTEAQTRVERYQVAAIKSYFKEDGHPETLTIKLPRLGSHADVGEEVTLDVPILALVGTNVLKIREFEVDFTVQLASVGASVPTLSGRMNNTLLRSQADAAASAAVPDATGPKPAQAAAESDPANPTFHEPLLIDLKAASAGPTGASAKVRVKVESQDQTEGVARLLNHLYSRF
ncbi:MAG TPA: DUF2589 domain-containing protein [Rhodopila sp.]|nr:DUF2589 domain-containing protein [Rhodopila sp.]